MIDIAVLTYNRRRLSETMLRELARRTSHTPHRVIVVDNGSTDETPEMLEVLWDEGLVNDLILLPENTGTHWGRNVGLARVTSDLFVSTDDDIVPENVRDGTDWLAKLVALMEERPELAALACRPHVMIGDNVYRMFEDAPPVRKRGHVGGALRLMRTQAVRDVGGWQNVKRPKRDNEERYICGKLKRAGWWVGYARDVRCIALWGEEGEDPWGYDADCKPEDHGHREIWPPVNRFNWRVQGVDWETCRREE
jgi:Glycosyltransferases, probably involved in cell wall biogenesis